MRSDLVKCGERVDDLQNGLFVIQDPKKFCFGMDAYTSLGEVIGEEIEEDLVNRIFAKFCMGK